MNKPKLSFNPTYHELMEGTTGPKWRPIYNPKRECVQQERLRIVAEGGYVDNNAWVPVKSTYVRHESSPVLARLALFSFISILLGISITSAVEIEWLEQQNMLLEVLVTFFIGAVAVSGLSLALLGFLAVTLERHSKAEDSREK